MELAIASRDRQEFSRRIVVLLATATAVLYLGWRMLATGTVTAAHGAPHGAAATPADFHPPAPALCSALPFVVLLLAIAVLPLFRATQHWWEHNRNRLCVAAGLGAVTLTYYAVGYGHGVVDHSTHTLSPPGLSAAVTVLKNALCVEYVPFIALLFSLYVISGGIAVEGRLVGRPRLNAAIIGLGGVLASLIGTTGAAMLLIRPLLRANQQRQYVAHTVIFFIFVVCNTGGCLLPIGDPPLFLGYLRGVHFTWTLKLWPMWMFVNLALLAVYLVWDVRQYRREDPIRLQPLQQGAARVTIRGGINFLWLAGVIAAVGLLDPSKPVPGTHWHAPAYLREVVMTTLAALSLLSTSTEIRRINAFNYDAILEVAALFVGIFICMQPPVQLLNLYGPRLGINSPAEFYWYTGTLSSFLDNAPTYVVFFETARSMGATTAAVAGVPEVILVGIALGAVFMGAMTYIGNGPNFMVKAIAEKNNVRMPSFFGYMGYSCGVLLPISLLMTWLFL